MDNLVTDLDDRQKLLALTFYTTARVGAQRLSDGGGPFGFDISKAMLFDAIMQCVHPEAIIETGCHTGDTTAYLGRFYSNTNVHTCDLDPEYAAITKRRLSRLDNVTVTHQDSREMLLSALHGRDSRDVVYLDAHWTPDWPLRKEIELSKNAAAIIIDDFDIGHDRFSFDSYGGERCGPQLIAKHNPTLLPSLLTYDPAHTWDLPCLQTGRRSGWGVIVPDARHHRHLIQHGLTPWRDA